jgi:crotonobetainyl-CoA:carnitine CoA-transferase CaiB-like acyl-CoA transferase
VTAGLLDGLRVLDFSLWQPGQYATQLLADLGADILKIEPPEGDRMRAFPDRFRAFNGHKRSLLLDLRRDVDRAEARRLAAEVEVVVEGYRPGAAERLGVGYDDLRAVNPALVYCSISGYGLTGPLAARPGHDLNYQAYAGALAPRSGESPTWPGVLVADQGGGLAAAFAVLAAVLRARRTGEGEHIDLAMADVVASWVGAIRRPQDMGHDDMGGDDDLDLPGLGIFATADGRHVVLGAAIEDRFWAALCHAVGLHEVAELSLEERSARADELRTALAAALARLDHDDAMARLEGADVPATPILTRAEMLAHPHFRARGIVTRGPDGKAAIGHPVRFLHHPARPPGPPPELPR